MEWTDAARSASGAPVRSASVPPDPRVCVVADGTPLLRAGLVGILLAHGYEIRADTGAGAELLDLADRHGPGVVVLGSVPDMPLVELVRRLRARPEPVRLVILLGRAAPDAIAELLSLDVDALLPRTIDGDALVAAVHKVDCGERVVDPAVLSGDGEAVERTEAASALTEREREVLVLLAEGHSNREIASSLFVSLPTVKTHLAHIYAKLGAKNRNEALGRAVAGGLL
jgi:DNA-binding NarL/FixJ family response regulator